MILVTYDLEIRISLAFTVFCELYRLPYAACSRLHWCADIFHDQYLSTKSHLRRFTRSFQSWEGVTKHVTWSRPTLMINVF